MNDKTLPISELLSVLAENLTDAQVLYADIQSRISHAISTERIRRKMNQSEFAELLDVSQTQVSKWENDDVNFTIKKLSEIATKLDLKLTCTLSPSKPASGFIQIRKNNVIKMPFLSGSSQSQHSAYLRSTSYQRSSRENYETMEG